MSLPVNPAASINLANEGISWSVVTKDENDSPRVTPTVSLEYMAIANGMIPNRCLIAILLLFYANLPFTIILEYVTNPRMYYARILQG